VERGKGGAAQRRKHVAHGLPRSDQRPGMLERFTRGINPRLKGLQR
jgi:hypothetical protein